MALNEDLNATLVTLEGRTLASASRPSEDLLTVQVGQRLFDAVLEKSGPSSPLAGIELGSIVRLTGVYVAHLDNNRRIQSFELLLRSRADAVVIAAPTWWTSQRALWMCSALVGVLLLVLAWVVALRKQVQKRTCQLNAEIEEHRVTEARLKGEIIERKKMADQVQKAHRELVAVSHQAGMAEVATSVLHNVGNVLNSVNVSHTVVTDALKNSKASNLGRAMDLLSANSDNLANFLANDEKGRQLPSYLLRLAQRLSKEQQEMLREMEFLGGNIEHIKEIVARQQSYARVSGVREKMAISDLVEAALRLDLDALERHRIRVKREYGAPLTVEIEKHKALQILVNLIQNAKNALKESGQKEPVLTVRIGSSRPGRAQIAVIDNGMGIAPENLSRVFAHGFTTRKNGHGFGLHSAALAARELGGFLAVESDGPGKGASFILEIPTASQGSVGGRASAPTKEKPVSELSAA